MNKKEKQEKELFAELARASSEAARGRQNWFHTKLNSGIDNANYLNSANDAFYKMQDLKKHIVSIRPDLADRVSEYTG